MAWAGITALLRDKFNANEILVSLMLVYVAIQVLNYMVFGPWKDPAGYNFPQSKTFEAVTQIPRLMKGSRMSIGFLIALAGVAALWVFLFRTRAGFAQQVGGLAPAAARYAGFSSRKALWLALLTSGGAAGLAGALEVAGPIGQLTPYVPAGYGFAAIIVAFVGRLHPVGMFFSAILMSMFYIGGELAQSRLGLPNSLTGVFQGLLLFSPARVRHLDGLSHPLRRSTGSEGIETEMESYALLFAATLNAGTVLAIAALGLLINEKAGIVNLGAEGMMLCAAIAGFATVVHSGNDWLGFAAGMGAGALLAAVFGVLVIWLNTNQYATGLALSLFGAGFSAFAGIKYVQEKLPERMSFSFPVLGDIPLVGPALFRQHPMVYLAMALVAWLVWFLYRSRAGLVLRSVGESPDSAHALGYPVRRIRLAAVVAGGALCGLAGRLPGRDLHAAVGGGHGGRQGLDRAGADHLRHLAAGPGAAGRLPVRRRHDAAVPPPGHRRGCAQPVPHHAAVPRHHRGAGADLAQPGLDPHQHAGFAWQAFLSRLIITVSLRQPLPQKDST